MELFLQALQGVFLSPSVIGVVFIGVVFGILFGCIPGLTATLAIIMFLPLTYFMPPLSAISMLVALYIGGISGGLVAAVLLNIPGTPASIATCFDGYPMAQKGEAKKALGTGIIFSCFGTLFGLFFLVIFSPLLAKIAIKFGPYEYCALTLLSLLLSVALAGKDMLKGLISAVLGAIFATVGLSPIDSVKRFTFGNYNLMTGFKLLVLLIGLFAVTEIFGYAQKGEEAENENKNADCRIKGFGLSGREFVKQLPNAIRSALIGLGIGILPGIGGSVSSLMSYTASRKMSKHPEEYGTGITDGVVASETANNATIGGAIIPLLSLGIPGDATTAVLLGGLMIAGVAPGPLIFEKNAATVYGVFVAMALAALITLGIELFGIRIFVKMLSIPKYILFPVILVLCCIGAIGESNRIFDCWGILIFGIIGFLMIKNGFPTVPVIMGFILGPILEKNVRDVSMIYRAESLTRHPIAIFFGCATVLLLVLKVWTRFHDKNGKTGETSGNER